MSKQNKLKSIINIPKELEKEFHIKFFSDKDVLVIYPKHKIQIPGYTKPVLI